MRSRVIHGTGFVLALILVCFACPASCGLADTLKNSLHKIKDRVGSGAQAIKTVSESAYANVWSSSVEPHVHMLSTLKPPFAERATHAVDALVGITQKHHTQLLTNSKTKPTVVHIAGPPSDIKDDLAAVFASGLVESFGGFYFRENCASKQTGLASEIEAHLAAEPEANGGVVIVFNAHMMTKTESTKFEPLLSGRYYWKPSADASETSHDTSKVVFVFVSDFGGDENSPELCDPSKAPSFKDVITAVGNTWGRKSLFYKLPMTHVLPLCDEGAISDTNRRRAVLEAFLSRRLERSSHGVAEDDFSIDTWSDRYIGQSQAIAEISERLKDRLNGYDDLSKPMVMAFLGPSGTGKTHLGEQIASIVHNKPMWELRKDKKFTVLQMGTYQDAKSIDTLTGPPVGIEGNGHLTGALMECPDAIVMLDEFEKAHPQAIPKVFLQAFDHSGVLKDNKRDIDVRTGKAVFIMTSNIGAAEMLELENKPIDPLTGRNTAEDIAQAEANAMAQYTSNADSNPFRMPEFQGRIDKVVMFRPYTQGEKERIAELAMWKLSDFFAFNADERKRFPLGWDHSALRALGHLFDGSAGVRPMLSAVTGLRTQVRKITEQGLLPSDGGLLAVMCDDNEKAVCLEPVSLNATLVSDVKMDADAVAQRRAKNEQKKKSKDHNDSKDLQKASSGSTTTPAASTTGTHSGTSGGGDAEVQRLVERELSVEQKAEKEAELEKMTEAAVTKAVAEAEASRQREIDAAIASLKDEQVQRMLEHEQEVEALRIKQTQLERDVAVKQERIDQLETQVQYLIATIAALLMVSLYVAKGVAVYMLGSLFLPALAVLGVGIAALLYMFPWLFALLKQILELLWYFIWQHPVLSAIVFVVLLVLWWLHKLATRRNQRQLVVELEKEIKSLKAKLKKANAASSKAATDTNRPGAPQRKAPTPPPASDSQPGSGAAVEVVT